MVLVDVLVLVVLFVVVHWVVGMLLSICNIVVHYGCVGWSGLVVVG